jgi:hypothetical protein
MLGAEAKRKQYGIFKAQGWPKVKVTSANTLFLVTKCGCQSKCGKILASFEGSGCKIKTVLVGRVHALVETTAIIFICARRRGAYYQNWLRLLRFLVLGVKVKQID